jgi:hypothetical protein
LETAVNASDPLAFKPFRPSQCRDPLAKRITLLHSALESHAKTQAIHNVSSSNKSGEKSPDQKNNFDQSTGQKNSSKSSIQKLEGEALKALDFPTSLPQEDGKPDTARCANWHGKSLRRRMFECVIAGKCTRCNGPHLRQSCTKSPTQWEDDYDKGPSFWNVPVKKQPRAQWSADLASCLVVTTEFGEFGIDTQSDVSTCLPCNLSAVRAVDPVTVNHLSGSTVLQTVGTLQFDGCPALDAVSVPASQLPPDMVGILGMPDIIRLGIPSTVRTAR